MSRLDSFIRRLSAQRDILNHVGESLIGTLEGPVMELGLGNGRTYDHLREKFPGRRIVAFDRVDRSHGPTAPDPKDLITGEIEHTAKTFVGIEAALVHADIGSGYDDIDAITLKWLPDMAAGLLRQHGIAVSGLPLVHAGLLPLEIPATVNPGRYFLYRKA
jgi:hypothetical protein